VEPFVPFIQSLADNGVRQGSLRKMGRAASFTNAPKKKADADSAKKTRL
jgi:hypothetical protein